LSIGFSAADDAYVCVSIGAVLNEVPKQFDAYYFTGEDRYAILTYCSVETIPRWGWDNARVTNNRAATLEEFRARLAAPIRLPMADRPLPEKLDGRTFRLEDLVAGALYRCGADSPMPIGSVANGALGTGVYMAADVPLGPGGQGALPRGQVLHCP
jgi:hypothetical protein